MTVVDNRFGALVAGGHRGDRGGKTSNEHANTNGKVAAMTPRMAMGNP
jgi:hypothetical protein